MTNIEFREKILSLPEQEWFNSISVKFVFNYVDYNHHITGITTIYEYVNQQLEGWLKHAELPNELKHSKPYFQNIKTKIIEFVKNNGNQTTSNLKSSFYIVTSSISEVNQKPLPYDIPEVDFLVNIYKNNKKYFNGAYTFIIETNNSNLSNRDNLYGAILAYEFALKNLTSIPERREAEENSISKLRIDFQQYLSEYETQLMNRLKNADDILVENIKKIESSKIEKEEKFEKWFKHIKLEQWEKWHNEKINLLTSLEETYEKKLKLDKPARYWERKSTKYYEEGNKAKQILIATVALSSLFLGVILVWSPDWIFTNVFKGNEISIVRWSIVFITLLSLIAYAIRALTKYMFSSYHLARDAEERHTLTFFYLALSKDSQVNDDDRKMILQSLFSRTDTGLLKDDSSPTLPTNDVINKFVNK